MNGDDLPSPLLLHVVALEIQLDLACALHTTTKHLLGFMLNPGQRIDRAEQGGKELPEREPRQVVDHPRLVLDGGVDGCTKPQRCPGLPASGPGCKSSCAAGMFCRMKWAVSSPAEGEPLTSFIPSFPGSFWDVQSVIHYILRPKIQCSSALLCKGCVQSVLQ